MSYVVRSRGSYCERLKGWRYWRMQSRHQGQAHYRKRQGMTGKQRRCGKWHTLEVNVTSLADLYMFYFHSWTWTIESESFGKPVTLLKHVKLAEVAITSGGCHIPLYFPTDPVISWIELVFAVLTESFSISIPQPSNNSIPLLASYMGVHIGIKSCIYSEWWWYRGRYE